MIAYCNFFQSENLKSNAWTFPNQLNGKKSYIQSLCLIWQNPCFAMGNLQNILNKKKYRLWTISHVMNFFLQNFTEIQSLVSGGVDDTKSWQTNE